MTNPENHKLVSMLTMAHYQAARNNKNNLSMVVAQTAYHGSQSYLQSLAAATLSLGGIHAPLQDARNLLRRMQKSSDGDFALYINGYIQNRKKIPGFGHSFYKDRIDPSFRDVYVEYANLSGGDDLVWKLSNYIKYECDRCERQIQIPPNAAIITAAICEFLNLQPGMEIAIAVSARVPAWIEGMNNLI